MAFVLLLSLFLRLINLNQSLWLDEAFQFKSTYFFSLKELLTVYLPHDFNPPLSYLINFYFNRFFGWSETALRFPSVIFGVLTVYLVYKLAKNIKLKKPVIPSLLLATAPLHLYYSQEARMYSLSGFLVTLSTLLLVNFLQQKTNIYWYVFSLSLTLYSHYLAWFIIPAHLVFIYLYKKQKLKKIISAQFISLLGFLPFIPFFTTQLKTGLSVSSANQIWSSTAGGLSIKTLALIPIKFLIGRISIENNYLFALILIPPFILTAWLFLKALKNFSKNKLAGSLLFSWLFTPLILIILISVKIPVLSYFRLLFLLPAFYLILSFGLETLKGFKFKLILTALLLINLTGSAIYLFNTKFHRENWKDLTQELVELNQTSSPVLIIPVVDAPLKYYYSQDQIIATDNLSKIKDSQEIWYIPYAEPIFDPQLTIRQKLKDFGFNPVFEKHFRGNLTLIKYSL